MAPFEALESRLLLSAPSQALAAQGFVPIDWQGQQVFARPGQWIAQLDQVGGPAARQLEIVNQRLAQVRPDVRAVRHLGSDGLVLLESPKALTHSQLQQALRGVGGFRHVEPDFAIWASVLSNDTSLGSQWGLHNTGQTGGTVDADIDAPEAWDLATGNGSVVVGVIDSGIDYNHPDLAANIWRNPGEIAGDGIDNDGNGYVDDVHGWDFHNNDRDPMDDNGHGTHVAGTIAAAGNNGRGVAGVSWNTKLMALKFLGADGTGSLSGAVAAINYATKMRTTHGVDVRLTNNSWTGGGYSSTLYNAIKSSGSAGMLFIAAAGNGGSDQIGDDNDAMPTYPASYDLNNIIAVAATDHHDRLDSFSNYGLASVDLAAPGVSILSTTRGGSYGWMSGTSMAAPHVAGVAALAWSHTPSASYGTVRDAIFKGVDAKSTLSGKVATGGRLNAFNTLKQLTPVVTTPAAPSGLAATAKSSSQIDLVWTDSSGNEEGFRIYRSTDGTNFALIAAVAANTTAFSNTGLSAGVQYHYLVRAYNSAGESASSNIASATTTSTTTVPAAPSALSVTALSQTQIRLTWVDNSGNETGFKIERSTNGNKWSQIAVVGKDVVAYTDSSLKRNTTYYYRVRAYNSVGHSSYSNTASTSTHLASVKNLSAALASAPAVFSTAAIRPAAAGEWRSPSQAQVLADADKDPLLA